MQSICSPCILPSWPSRQVSDAESLTPPTLGLQAIIGTIGDIDQYQLPDAKGHTAFMRHILGITDEERQARREQVLATTLQDFRWGAWQLTRTAPVRRRRS